jgi:hypothetical protein
MLYDDPSSVAWWLERQAETLLAREQALYRDPRFRIPDLLGCHDGSLVNRFERLRSALWHSGGDAEFLIERRLAGLNLSAIWPILRQVCEDIALC